MAALWEQIGAEQALGAIADQRIEHVGDWGQLPALTPVVKGEGLFPRLVDRDSDE